MKSIIIIGYMGAGKTTVGKALAKELGVMFYDLDWYIETRMHKTVKEIFDGHGDFNLVMMQKKLVPNYETFDDSFVFTGVQIGKRTAFGSWKAPDNGKPLLYSSLGTAFNNWPEYYPILFDAVRDLDINVFAALGSIDPASLKDIPANVVAVGNPCRVLREISPRDWEYYHKDRKIDID